MIVSIALGLKRLNSYIYLIYIVSVEILFYSFTLVAYENTLFINGGLAILKEFKCMKKLNNKKDRVKISHFVYFQGHIFILGEVIRIGVLAKT